MAKKVDIPMDNNIIKVPIEEAMPDNYLPYAVEVAKDRALPDVRDGLKPVHRRILYGAYLLKAFPDRPYFKSARIVGDILGKFHPHGDSSVYDAMVILAQDFSTRKTLIDGQGNYGSIDGDSAAAMRYTEARLTPIALEMLRDIDKDTVDMMENYSASELEPTVLPARYPNLLVNGVFGIAVGLATNIPPHNLCEVIDATLALIDDSEISVKELMKYIKGPDLPTGGVLIGKDSLRAAYESGNGKVTLRAKTNIEKLENGRLGIIITEFPYRKNKAKLLQTISEMTADKKHSKALEGIIDIRDESDRTGIRAVIELKKAIENDGAEKILKYLLKKTELQINLPFNMVALADGKPETLSLKAILYHYIKHQRDVVTRRTKKELEVAEKRFHIVEGFIKAINILDQVIATIRASKSKANAEENLVNEFGFTNLQAQAILELMLYRLTGLEIKVFEKEYKELERLIQKLRKILSDEKELLKVIKKELTEIKEKHGDDRKTEIIDDDSEAKIDVEELIVVEDVVMTLSQEGYIKRIPLKNYARVSGRPEDIDYREGDFLKETIHGNTQDTLIIFTDKGNMYQCKVNDIPEEKYKEKGVRCDTIIKTMSLDNEKIIKSFSINNFSESKEFVFFTSKGNIKKTSVSKFITAYSKIAALKLKENEFLIAVEMFSSDREETFIKIDTSELSFTMEEKRIEESDRSAATVSLVNLPETDEVKAVTYVESYEFKDFVIQISSKGIVKVKNSLSKNDNNALMVNSSSKILIFSSSGSVLKSDALLFQNLKNPVELRNKYPSFLGKNDIVVGSIILSDNTNESVVFSTKNGYVKRTNITEFIGDYAITQGYKLKNEEDRVIGVSLSYNIEEDNIILITQKAMVIKFPLSQVNEMGKIASGVIGISLKDGDNVIYSRIIKEDVNLKLNTNNKEEVNVNTETIPSQNRGGRGKLAFLCKEEDYVSGVRNVRK